MITSSSLQRKSPRSHEPPHYQQSPGRARQRSTSSSATNAAATVPLHHSPSSRLASSSSSRRDSAASCRAPKASASPAASAGTHQFSPSSRAGPARFPSPPPSSSPTAVVPPPSSADDANLASMDAIKRDDVSVTQFHPPALASDPRQQQPSPPSDDYRIHGPSAGLAAQPAAGPLAPPVDAPVAPVVHVRDLAHITTLVQEGMIGGPANGPSAGQTKYEISAMPINDVIDMVAALLTKITTTNDLQHDAMQRNVTHQQQANQTHDASGSHMSPLSHSVLAFHGKNVPAISILSYLGRIHKYCPTTYEVFLSLLVYFDRMTERVNDRVVKTERARQRAASQSQTYPAHSRSASRQVDTTMRDTTTSATDNSDETDSDLADDDDDDADDAMVDSPTAREDGVKPFAPEERHVASPATYFVVDSFNIHRLIISGVTCASKFFSDVFYTNSRYAKVGGLPLAELNHLELQFLVLNDFRLAIPVEELEGYATMLVEFYAREVVAKGVGIK
ncbi:cyclin-dependent protein kinase complex component [Cordyceps fumosorosea ARSEF 2679]|uniref:Cyclin-dependent protein kinase complex component n=1 Tax=Cordyceps fumosorosea (strain ARSEF 2679) TaxID=1081104 RepID=A0A167RLF1_CORFA|nr:cyclin-dependent protein kinase complex component [Cordyceps fumosorosea ARSEF 2679]OAA58710.1 cyclin-dependent protein kinase complex component [Cordyceps fumosorosea ARSEF 2679]